MYSILYVQMDTTNKQRQPLSNNEEDKFNQDIFNTTCRTENQLVQSTKDGNLLKQVRHIKEINHLLEPLFTQATAYEFVHDANETTAEQ